VLVQPDFLTQLFSSPGPYQAAGRGEDTNGEWSSGAGVSGGNWD
jgi:hypothetical protein